MKKIKTIMPIVLGTTTVANCLAPTMTSCSKNDLLSKLKSMPRVEKVEVLDNLPQFQARYMVWFKHPIDWNDESKGSFLQRCEFCFRGYDRVNQLFTCGYELRAEVLNRSDYEIAEHFNGNLIKPEYRFFDKSRPQGLDNHKVAGWEYLTNTQAVADFHSMITAFKTLLSGKWAFTGTSKGGETTNAFAMTYPDDCTVYVPYVAPKFYTPQGSDAKVFQYNVYNTIGDRCLGTEVAKQYRTEVAKFQYYALKNRKAIVDGKYLYEKFWEPYEDVKFCNWVNKNHETVYDICIQECGTQFWQGKQDIWQLIEFNKMTDDTDEKNKKCIEIAQGLNDPTGWSIEGLFFPYAYQAKTEMGEYDYDFVEMKKSIATVMGTTPEEIEKLLCHDCEESDRVNFCWRLQFTDEQFEAWKDKFDGTFGKEMEKWNETCPVNVIRIYGGADVWTALRLEDKPSKNVKIYYGDDAVNPHNRSHTTRIKGLSPAQQKEIWAHLEDLLK